MYNIDAVFNFNIYYQLIDLFAVLGQTQDFEHARQALYC
jgi:hypothetical protein